MAKVLKSGAGWRVGWNPEAATYQGLIGTDDWAIELTAAELTDIRQLAAQLADTMKSMASELMDEEGISLEAETDRVWLEATGFPQAYSLRLILNTGRQVEGFWPSAVVRELLDALPGE
jgi:hypothetical protein